MPKEKAPSQKRFPQKELSFRSGRRDELKGVKVQFRRIDSGLGQFDEQSGIYAYNKLREPGSPESQYNPKSFHKYPSIYSVELSGGYTFDWDVLNDEYFENRGWLTYDQVALYSYIKSLRNRGYHVSVRGRPGPKIKDINGNATDERDEVRGLAQISGRSPRHIERDLDVLEDCFLIHRVRRLDLSGAPNEIVVHSPFTIAELEGGDDVQGYAEIIEERLVSEATRSRRRKIETTGIGKDGRKFVYHNRRADASTFMFDARDLKVFGDRVDSFVYWAMIYFQNEWMWLAQRKGEWQKAFREKLFVELSSWGIHDNEQRHRCYSVANKFRTIYCPLEEELIAA